MNLAKRMREDAAAPVVSSLDIGRVRAALVELLELREQALTATANLERMTKKIREIETETLPTLLDEVGVSKITVDGHVLTVVTEYFPLVRKADEQQFFDWLREQALDAIIKNELKIQFDRGEDEKAIELATELIGKNYAVALKQAIHASTLKAFVKEQQEKGAPLPPMLDINPVRTTKIK